MIDQLQAMLLRRPGSLTVSLFPQTSRYYGIPTATLVGPDGREVVYLCRRLVPQPDGFTVISEHTVAAGDRLDNVTAQYLGDPEQFWRLCDANSAMRPDELTETPGRRLRITLPEGVPGSAPITLAGAAQTRMV